ncbi:autotransporter outer membrane beta-barrel domain-containing protein [Erwinia sp. MMLR14_017]|uniref:autotransporter outer membrane beta-barrel domain-containing protein n=1 Tax=Erwinia sp. MMLR14_017 TaxID=3093842 RepID=UPI002990246E|nr:autotransporter outer membrane beta-barrel domain-containing protein [Erwinia sp. MMLR14_017]MDW8847729.1 autotransporter outer membrane beta-barrel domain-containing protein [Erwinia sp. MMLR14_017]
MIGSGVQNATGMHLEGGPDATMLNNGTIDVNGRAQFQPVENVAMLVVDSGTGGKVGNAGTINLNGDNSTGLKVIARGESSASAWSSGAINVTGNADEANGTRNTAVWVSGQDGGHASATLTGPVTLSGEAAIGIRAEGNATVNVDQNAVPRSGGGQYQINFLAIGPDAKIELPTEGNYSVSGWHSTVFRYQEGADFDGAGLTIVPDASFSTGIIGSGNGTDINTNGAVLNVGLYSTGVVVEGGAQGMIDSATTLNLTSLNSTAAMVDGLKHDLTGYITNISSPDATTSLINHAAISGMADRQVGLIAQNRAQLTNTGDITLAGDSTTGIMASYGAKVTNSGDISVTRSGTGIRLFDGSFADSAASPTVVTNNGNIDVGASSEAVLPTQGISLSGLRGQFYQNGTISLHGDNVIAGEVYDNAVLYLGDTSTVKFNNPGQTGYVGSDNAVIASYGGSVEVSTAGSTLYNLRGGTLFNPLAAADITLNGANSVGTLASGVGTTLFGTDRYLVNGNGATAVLIAEGARASITSPIVLNGANTTGAVSDAGGATLFGLAPITGSGAKATGYDVGNGASLDNHSQVDLTGEESTGVRLHSGGNFTNRAPVTVASGTGVDLSSGYGSYTPLNSELRASDGTAAMRVGNSAVLEVVGDGLYRSTIVSEGRADGILLDKGASSFTASDIIIGSYGSGSAINNRAETAGISLNNVFIDASGSGNGLRSATSFDYGGNAYINVTGDATGYLFGNEDGSVTSNDLVIGPNYTIFVTGSGSAIRANTTGRVISDGFVTIYSQNGGSAIVTSTASEVINRGSIFSFSTTSPIIDLRGGQSVFINEGDLTAPFPETVVVAGGAANDTIALLDGNVVGDVNTGNGTDSVAITGGRINGSLTMGSGINNQALIKSVDLKNVSHLTTAGGKGSTLSLSDITAQGGSFSEGDNLTKGVNLGTGWSTLNLLNTNWTLTDNLKLAHSTLNIDRTSTLYVGNQVDPVLAGGTNDSLVVNNAGTLDLTNGNGVAGNSLTLNGGLASAGGSLRLNTLLGSTLNSQQSDTLRVNGNATGTTLLEDSFTAGSTAMQADSDSNGVLSADEGITLAQVSGRASANSFALKGGYVAAGPWQYGLYSFAPGSADASQRLVSGSGDQFWDYRLANNYICEAGSLCQPQAGNSSAAVSRPAVVPQLPSYLSAPVGLAYSTLAMLDDLHKRLGELRDSESDPQGIGGEMFLRYTGSNLKYMTNVAQSKYGYDFDLDYNALQVGANLMKFEGNNQSLRGGIAYTRGNTRIRPYAADGYSSTSFDSDSLALYTTWQRDNKFYLDGTLTFDWHRGDTDIARQKEVATLKGKGWNASLETGYPFELGSGIRLEPQAQLTWLHLKMDNFTDEDRTTVNYDNYDQTLGRVGARLDRTWQDEAERHYTPYLRTNYTRGWGGTAKVTVGAADTAISQSFNSGKFGQMWDVGIGGTTTFKNAVSIYAEADYSKEIEGNGAKGWGYNAGVRWTF